MNLSTAPSPHATLLEPIRLLWRRAGRWLPLVSALALLSAVPDALLAHYLPDPTAVLTTDLDLGRIATVLAVMLAAAGVKIIVQLVALMLAFVVLADLTAGRKPDLGAGLARLASWRLQGAWIVAGIAEQVAMSLWFLGGAALLVPWGLATTSAYEEGCGFAAFGQSNRLGQVRLGPGGLGQAGTLLAAGVTVAFAAWFVADTLIGLLSCAGSMSGSAGALQALSSGAADPAALQALLTSAAQPPRTTPLDIALGLVVAPLSMLPSVYMMTLQQQIYWRARASDPAPTDRK